MAELAVLLLGSLVVAAVAVRFGILIGRRLDDVVSRDDEEPRGPAA
jgi:hypothetical protein